MSPRGGSDARLQDVTVNYEDSYTNMKLLLLDCETCVDPKDSASFLCITFIALLCSYLLVVIMPGFFTHQQQIYMSCFLPHYLSASLFFFLPEIIGVHPVLGTLPLFTKLGTCHVFSHLTPAVRDKSIFLVLQRVGPSKCFCRTYLSKLCFLELVLCSEARFCA